MQHPVQQPVNELSAQSLSPSDSMPDVFDMSQHYAPARPYTTAQFERARKLIKAILADPEMQKWLKEMATK